LADEEEHEEEENFMLIALPSAPCSCGQLQHVAPDRTKTDT